MSARNEKLVWVSRPKIRSKSLIAFLKKEGFKVLHQPVIHVHPVKFTIEDINQPADALVFTSKNAVNVMTPFREDKSTLCVAVGESTADLLKESGFVNVVSVDGTVDDLQAYIDNNFHQGQNLLYFSGEMIKKEITANQADIKRLIVYRIEEILDVDPEFLERFLNINLACFFSSATYKVAWNLIEHYKLEAFCHDIDVVVLRDMIIPEEQRHHWKSVTAAAHPSMMSLQKTITEQY